MRSYAERWGYAFHFSTMPPGKGRQAYWAKMDLVRSYLDKGYDWVLYTDIDVLIIDHSRPLQDFMVNRDIISVAECTVRVELGRNNTNPVIRSGFLLLRNGPDGRGFLDTWAGSYEAFKDIENPDQTSLESIHASPEWNERIHLADWRDFHAYDNCDRSFASFSLHFPGAAKVERVAKAFFHLSMAPGGRGTWAAKDRRLVEHAGKLLRQKLLTFRKRDNKPPKAQEWKPPPDEARAARLCLDRARSLGYDVDAKYDKGYHKYAHFYLLASHQTNIPNAVFFALPKRDEVPPLARGAVRSWALENPFHQVTIHSREDAKRMVDLLLPGLSDVWAKLIPEQRLDIHRYLSVGLLGGIASDSDMVCTKPVAEWGHHSDDSMILGVDEEEVSRGPDSRAKRKVLFGTQVLGSAAFQPAMLDLLNRIEERAEAVAAAADPNSTPDELVNALSEATGRAALTDAVANYLCYGGSRLPGGGKTPDDYYAGGHAPGAHVFDVPGFSSVPGETNAVLVRRARSFSI
ncbi:hypothetical protein DFJ74DRAFT_679919 [Hyaloraphidium curvatum]|nr:hypothetical protein DFJ74DRAFT_679919 [Hyaloraphidium curvatum]